VPTIAKNTMRNPKSRNSGRRGAAWRLVTRAAAVSVMA
jgi:hypothetical protein